MDVILKIHSENLPVILDEDLGIRVLIDTGATISVYTNSLNLFLETFPSAYNSGDKTLLGGFGGHKKSLCDVYIIPVININGVCIYDLPIIVWPNKYVSNDIILSAYVFKKTSILIDYINSTVNLINYNRPIHCSLIRSTKHNNFVKGFLAFTQDDMNK